MRTGHLRPLSSEERRRQDDAELIEIRSPDPGWPRRYLDEARTINRTMRAYGIEGMRFEHFGSTSVPGLPAKPIIDIMMLPPPGCDWRQLVVPLLSLGYVHWRDNVAPERMFFVKSLLPQGRQRTHHLHVMTLAEADKHLRFRDYLRRHPDVAEAYADLKCALARQHPHDRAAYTRGKDAFFAMTLGQANAERILQR